MRRARCSGHAAGRTKLLAGAAAPRRNRHRLGRRLQRQWLAGIQRRRAPALAGRSRFRDERATHSPTSGRSGRTNILLRLAIDVPTATSHGATPQGIRPDQPRDRSPVLAAKGKSNRDIAQILGLSPRTVDKHLEQIYAKLGVENRTSAAAMAAKILDKGGD